MKVIPLIILPAISLLVSACAPEVVEPRHAGYGPGYGPAVVVGGPGYYDHHDGYDHRDDRSGYYDNNHSSRTENDVTVNRTNVNERTLNINKTNVNQAKVSRHNGNAPARKTVRKGDGKPNEDQGNH